MNAATDAGAMPSVWTIEQAAADLQVEPARLWAWHNAGRLLILYTAGDPKAGRRGTKDGRIPREEWERFKRSLAVTVSADTTAPVADAPTGPKRGRPVGGKKAPGSDLLGEWRRG